MDLGCQPCQVPCLTKAMKICKIVSNVGRLRWPYIHWNLSTKPFYRLQTKFAKVMFLHVSVCPWCDRSRPMTQGDVGESGGGWVSRPRARGVGGVWLEGCPGPGPGRSRFRPGGGWVSQHVLSQTPPNSRQVLLRTVRILLECILFVIIFCDLKFQLREKL